MDELKLLEAIDSQSVAVSTDSLDISFGEISSMYDDGELEIRPSYQRLFRWSSTQQSQFIESILLELPIPPIFVIETETRKYELIDGLQRISTYLHFLGKLESRPGKSLTLRDCEIVEDLNGIKYEDLPNSLRIKVKRSYVRMYIIKKESPSRIKYDMFKRLNTGGSLLEAQEIRNSTIRFLSEQFVDFIQEMANNKYFKKCTSFITDYQLDRQFNDELVLRYFTIKNAPLTEYKREEDGDTLASYLTKYAEDVAQGILPFDYEKEKQLFEAVFADLANSFGEYAFSAIINTGKKAKFGKHFYSYEYEAISVGLAKVYQAEKEKRIPKEDLKDKIIQIKINSNFKDYTENKKHKRTNGKDYLKFLNLRVNYVVENL